MDLPSKVVLVPMKYFLFSILSFFLLSNIVFGQSSQYESVNQESESWNPTLNELINTIL